MHRVQLLLLAITVLPFAACGGPETAGAGGSDNVRRAAARLGPVRYSFDASRLSVAEVMLALPPAYEHTTWAVKLIPLRRAGMLGTMACDYRGTGMIEMCNSQDEPGLAMALLERPIDDYRAAFASSASGDFKLFRTTLDGVAGFGFTARPEAGARQYRFVPVDERTLLLARLPGPVTTDENEALEEVIASVDLGG